MQKTSFSSQPSCCLEEKEKGRICNIIYFFQGVLLYDAATSEPPPYISMCKLREIISSTVQVGVGETWQCLCCLRESLWLHVTLHKGWLDVTTYKWKLVIINFGGFAQELQGYKSGRAKLRWSFSMQSNQAAAIISFGLKLLEVP